MATTGPENLLRGSLLNAQAVQQMLQSAADHKLAPTLCTRMPALPCQGPWPAQGVSAHWASTKGDHQHLQHSTCTLHSCLGACPLAGLGMIHDPCVSPYAGWCTWPFTARTQPPGAALVLTHTGCSLANRHAWQASQACTVKAFTAGDAQPHPPSMLVLACDKARAPCQGGWWRPPTP